MITVRACFALVPVGLLVAACAPAPAPEPEPRFSALITDFHGRDEGLSERDGWHG